jgi:hypothetical protein
MPPQDAKVAMDKYKQKRKDKDIWSIVIIIGNSQKIK